MYPIIDVTSHDLKQITDAALCGLLVVDPRGTIAEANSRAAAMLGYSVPELVGQPLAMLLPPDERPRHAALVEGFFHVPTVRVMGKGLVLNAWHREGRALPVEISLIPSMRGQQELVIATIVDVSERRAMEEELRRAQVTIQVIVDNLPAKVAFWDSNLNNIFANRQYKIWYGVPQERDISGLYMLDVVGPEMFEFSRPYVERVLAGEPQEFERLMPDRVSGETRYLQVSYIPNVIRDEVRGFFVLGTDITRRKQAELALVDEKERTRITLSSIGDAVIATDREGKVTYLNPVAQDMTGWRRDSALGKPIEEVMELINGSTGKPVTNPVQIAIRDERKVGMALDCVLRCRSGGEFGVEDAASPIVDHLGNTVGGVIVFRDVSESRAMALRMSHLAQHDPLTDLPNRVLLHDRLGQAIERSQRTGSRFALLFLDLDHFKDVNDTLGHSVGDELLRAIAKRLATSLRSSDTVSRQGGDEFIALLNDVSSVEQVAEIASKVIRKVSAPYILAGNPTHGPISATFSVGISLYPEDAKDAESLMRHADAALYMAKRQGRNRYWFFSAELGEAISLRNALLSELRTALSQNRFRLVYQPIVDSRSKSIVGVEGLIRWSRQNGELALPGSFIGLAEESGLILPLGRWVLREACRQMKEWIGAGLRAVPMNVNISARQFRDTQFVDDVQAILRESGVPAHMLQLEITETTVMEEGERSRAILDRLRALGVRIAIDDFGTGYSSLGYLSRFPVNTLKVDGSFVRGIGTDENCKVIVSVICDLGRRLNLHVVAEGVETLEQEEFLNADLCDSLQGYRFSAPIEAENMAKLLVAA